MVLFPHAKINLGLQVTEKRHDGFHNIISCLYPIQWCDVLEIIEAPKLHFHTSGLVIPGKPEDNLCLQAFKLIENQFDIPPVYMHLHKVVPMGAGLGGGSSDAVFTLKGLQKMFNLPLSDEDLRKLAAKLGSDCAFFVDGAPCLVSGRGDQIERTSIPLLKGHIVVVTPPIEVNTGIAYSMLTPKEPKASLKQSLALDISKWSKLVTNDFEGPVFRQFPQIAKIKEILLSKGAVYASLSGSGSSVFGIFEEKQKFSKWFGSDKKIWVEKL